MDDNQNVVELRRAPSRSDDMEWEIHDLVRIADLAMHVWLSEQEEEITASNGSVLQVILEDIQRRLRKLDSRDRSDGDDPVF